MAGYVTIVEAIKTKLEAVSGIANVYSYPRFKDTWTDYKSLILTGSTVHFWFISRDSAPADAVAQGQNFFDHTWSLWGFYAVVDADASYKTFQGICDDVTDAFNGLTDINIATNTVIEKPCELIEFAEVRMPPVDGGVLCHRARIQLITNEDKTC